MTNQAPELSLSREDARAILDAAIERHFAKVRARIPAFVDRHFGWKGAWDLNKKGLGGDLLRAPMNGLLVLPHALSRLAALGLDLTGRNGAAERMRSIDLFLKTDVAREIEFLIWSELFELPYRDEHRITTKDGIAQEVLSDPRVQSSLNAVHHAMQKHWRPEGFYTALAHALSVYGGNRAAGAELANIFLYTGAGAVLVHQATPGVLTLGPALASLIAQGLTSSALPSTVTALWLTQAAAHVPVSLALGTTLALATASAATASISGAVTDPLQRALGLHQRRLVALADAAELALLGDEKARLVAHDHYAGRIADLLDIFVGVWRFARA